MNFCYPPKEKQKWTPPLGQMTVPMYVDVCFEIGFARKFVLAKLTLMRLLFEVDCHDVPLEIAFV